MILLEARAQMSLVSNLPGRSSFHGFCTNSFVLLKENALEKNNLKSDEKGLQVEPESIVSVKLKKVEGKQKGFNLKVV